MKNKLKITGIILAGGKSSRIGSDKGLLSLNGSSFIAHIIKAIKPLVNDIIIVSHNKSYNQFGFKRVNDLIENSGPVAGIYSGLYHSKTELNLIVSCDVPLIKTKILNLLIKGYNPNNDVIQLQSKNKTMPLLALYKKQCMDKCLEFLQKDERRLRIVVSNLKTKTIAIDSEFDKYLKNINTKDDLKDLNYAIEY